ncbi:hypothetical protein [Rhodococcus triatomae]|nr:hypothetical protein G419_25564 [Rhodococcus triatomae BKS 15-14]
MVVIGPSVVDVVRLLGGWVFDRVTSGWDATVAVADHPDVRPLQILGARTLDLETALDNQIGPHPQVIAVSVDLFQADDRIRNGVLATLDRGDMDVALWGENWPANLDERFCTGQHHLSGAARVFKAQAMAAANAPADNVVGTEVLRTAEMLSPRGGLRLVSAS